MKRTRMAIAALTGVAGLAAHAAWAQNSVTLYGVVDNGIAYQNNGTTLGSSAPGHAAVKMSTGVWLGDRVGFKGSEDLGGGSKAVFTLESGFSAANGTSQYTNGLFTRQAWVGLANAAYGTLTAGRQYTAYYTLLAPYSPTTWLTGYFGAHPGDIDSLDTLYRANNSLVYMSPSFHGLTLGGSYSFGGEAGSVNAGSTWSAGVQYMSGPFGVAAAFQRINNSNSGGGVWGANSTTSNGGAQTAVSAINNGYVTAQAQQRWAITAGYKFSAAWEVTGSYTNVQYIPGVNSTFRNTAVFNTAGAVVHFKPTVAWDFAAGYAYTHASKANGTTSSATYQQFTLTQYYALSKRTGVYAAQAYQRASGQTLNNGAIVNATASIGDGFSGSPSSTRSQIGLGVGVVHRF